MKYHTHKGEVFLGDFFVEFKLEYDLFFILDFILSYIIKSEFEDLFGGCCRMKKLNSKIAQPREASMRA